jgi:DNA-binding NtrC family response regulator
MIDHTKWLHSPVSEKAHGLKPVSDLLLEPYFGKSKKLKLFRTRYLLGSSELCDIQIEDPYVSPQHAELVIQHEGAPYQLIDLASKNGVFLNGTKVQSAPLPEKGSIQIGRSKLRWKTENAEISGDWIAKSDSMRRTLEDLREIARSDLSVLLLGETGTGKEFLARFVHENSQRAKEKYVAVNGSLTDGPLAESELFGHTKGAFTGAEMARVGAIRSANHGTLFLDEVADIPLGAQVKLLRALELGEVKPLGADQLEKSNFRIVSATSQDIHKKIHEKTFRSDLFFRMAGATLRIPPLRERSEDILAITANLLGNFGFELSKEAKGILLSYSWPGNVRELKSWVQRAMVRAKAQSTFVLLPEFFDQAQAESKASVEDFKGKSLEQMEREMLLQALNRNGWARKAAAEELQISRSTLYDKMKKFGIKY